MRGLATSVLVCVASWPAAAGQGLGPIPTVGECDMLTLMERLQSSMGRGHNVSCANSATFVCGSVLFWGRMALPTAARAAMPIGNSAGLGAEGAN